MAPLAAFFVPSANAGKTSPLSLGLNGGGERQQPVEQWTDQFSGAPGERWPLDRSQWVINPTGFSWDVDDHWNSLQTNAELDATTTYTTSTKEVSDVDPSYSCIYSMCTWWSHGQRDFQVFTRAPVPGLVTSVCYEPQSRCFTPPVAFNPATRGYESGLCVKASYADTDPAVAMIPGSNGDYDHVGPLRGLGLLSTISVSFTNTTGRTIKPIFAYVAMVGAGGDGPVCTWATGYEDTFDYPFSWRYG